MSFSKTKTTQEIDSSTTVTNTNQQQGASEGSTVIRAGGNVERVDAELVDAAGNLIFAAGSTLNRGYDTIDNIADNQVITNRDNLNFAQGVNQDSLVAVGNTVEQANALLSKSFEQSSNILARNAGVRGSDEVKTDQTALYVIGGVAALGLIIFLRKK